MLAPDEDMLLAIGGLEQSFRFDDDAVGQGEVRRIVSPLGRLLEGNLVDLEVDGEAGSTDLLGGLFF